MLPLVDGEVLGEAEMVEAYPEVPIKKLAEDRWKLLWAAPFHDEEDIHVKEAFFFLLLSVTEGVTAAVTTAGF